MLNCTGESTVLICTVHIMHYTVSLCIQNSESFNSRSVVPVACSLAECPRFVKCTILVLVGVLDKVKDIY